VGEEGVETAIAAVALEARGEGEDRRQRFIEEATDLIFHLLVLLQASGVEPEKVASELLRRHGFARP
jgi:phosphoribosyl-ATP pyrophosphohydrolase